MKIRLKSFYGEATPGQIIDVDEAEGARVISVGGAIAYAPTEEEKADAESAAKAAAEAAAKKQTGQK